MYKNIVLSKLVIKNIKFISVITIIILFTGLFLPKEYKEKLKTSFQTTENISNEDRIVMWKTGIEIFKENPIFGIGSYKKGISTCSKIC